jgi:hypothetical protein
LTGALPWQWTEGFEASSSQQEALQLRVGEVFGRNEGRESVESFGRLEGGVESFVTP